MIDHLSRYVRLALLDEDRWPPDTLWSETLVSSRLLEYEAWTRIHSLDIANAVEILTYDDRMLVAAKRLRLPLSTPCERNRIVADMRRAADDRVGKDVTNLGRVEPILLADFVGASRSWPEKRIWSPPHDGRRRRLHLR
jgi:hypothetical protein